MRLLLLALLVVAAPALAAPDVSPSAGEELPLPPPPPPGELGPEPGAHARVPQGEPRLGRFGLLVDAGVPDGAVFAAMFRPVDAVRLTFGPTHNGLGWGLQGGVGLVPFAWIVTPSMNLEAGRYFGADLRWLADERGVPDELRPLLRDVGYNYASAQLGLEVGSSRGLSFFVRAGLSWVRTTVRGTVTTTSNGTTVELSDPRLTGSLPSVKLGLLYWF